MRLTRPVMSAVRVEMRQTSAFVREKDARRRDGLSSEEGRVVESLAGFGVVVGCQRNTITIGGHRGGGGGGRVETRRSSNLLRPIKHVISQDKYPPLLSRGERSQFVLLHHDGGSARRIDPDFHGVIGRYVWICNVQLEAEHGKRMSWRFKSGWDVGKERHRTKKVGAIQGIPRMERRVRGFEGAFCMGGYNFSSGSPPTPCISKAKINKNILS